MQEESSTISGVAEFDKTEIGTAKPQTKPECSSEQSSPERGQSEGHNSPVRPTTPQTAQTSFSREMKEKTSRQLRIACPDASEHDIQQMLTDGENRDTVVRRQMAGSHAMLLEQLEQVHDKYRAIRRLEKSMTELHQLFLDMATLVEHQGEILDMIEVNVAKTKDNTAAAEKELITARKAQWSSQRRLCCLTVIMLLIVMVVIFPVMFGV